MAQDTATVTAHPAHIHLGTCADLDPNPVAPLQSLLPIGVNPDDDDVQTQETLGVLTVGPVAYSETDDVDFDWDAMLETSHALAVHESDENIQNYIACGDIGGVVFSDDDDERNLVIGLHPVGESGFSGIAFLSKDDDGDVDVEVYLVGAPSDANAAPDVSATPAN
ncbi:MAG: hypothetical protein M9953_02925 [Thermomicrobiales bacterium]|nr:hypothetical protein [Thermomicrobiales bacterium]MCO5219918.1 hypothetical protein [Thermomicrobiales bacterium]MCO5224269.1 hypothetical protein [Thermomicrobiales bacterium]